MNVWIDTDVSIGSPIREVDDAFALVLAFHSPELHIAGISTTYGNASLRYVDLVARDLVQRIGGIVNVFRGAAAACELGHVSAASDALAHAAASTSLTYIALGPVTNLATALRLHPQLRQRISQIIFLSGVSSIDETRPRVGKWLRIHDANVFKDPAAAEIVLASGIPLLLVPISTAWKLMIDQNDMARLRAAGGAAEFLARKSKWWLRFWRTIARTNGGPVFDALAVIAAINSELVETETSYAFVDGKQKMLVATAATTKFSVRFCTGFRSKAKSLLMNRLTTPADRHLLHHGGVSDFGDGEIAARCDLSTNVPQRPL